MNAPLVLSVLAILLLVLIPLLLRSARRSSDLKWSILELLGESPYDWSEDEILTQLHKRSKLFKRLSRYRLYSTLRSLERTGYIRTYRKPLTHPGEDRFYQLSPQYKVR